MRLLIKLVLFVCFFSISVFCQDLPEWNRVLTLDESFVELETDYVMFSTRKIERVRFRWTYQNPQKFDEKSSASYQKISQEIQFDCNSEKSRTYDMQWFDSEGNLVSQETKKASGEWQNIKPGSTMGKLFSEACKLIALRKREPALEQ